MLLQFCGGKYNGLIISKDKALKEMKVKSYSNNYTKERESGLIVPREELDDQPQFEGYLGPMYNGVREFEGSERVVLRYETQEVYNLMSD